MREDDLSWDAFLQLALINHDAVGYEPSIADAERTTQLFFSSTRTGETQAIPWTHITPIKSAADGWVHHDIQIGDVVAWPARFCEMMGPWSIYASLLNGGTLALFEGLPQGRSFGEFVQNARVNILGVSPSQVKIWRASGCMSGLNWGDIKCFSATGETSNAEDMHWLTACADYKPVIEYCGATALGGAYLAGNMMQPQVPAMYSTKALGVDFCILDEAGSEATQGNIFLKMPILGSSNALQDREQDVSQGPQGQMLRWDGGFMEALPRGYYKVHGD
jgi:acetyl-CoA synthetase